MPPLSEPLLSVPLLSEPLLSVVTAVHGSRRTYLYELAASLRVQDLPPGWAVEWLVQEDGPASPYVRDLGDAEPTWLPAANGVPRGIAHTRNAALARARGAYVRVVDSDDLLLPGSLREAVEVLERHRDVHWCVGQADDLLPDGRRAPYASPISPGRLTRGTIGDHLLAHGEVPVHCAGLTARADVVRALGGWADVARSEDVSLLVALSETADGYLSPAPTWLYRQHPGQTTRGQDWHDLHDLSRQQVLQRLRAVRRTGLGFAADGSAQL